MSLYTEPRSHVMDSTETHPLTLDATAYLGVGESVSAAEAHLFDLTSGREYAEGIDGSVDIDDDNVLVTITGLEAGHSYLLKTTFTAAVGKIMTMLTEIECPS